MVSMATRNTSAVRRWRNSSGFTGVLTSAVLEWLLIFLLFVNALFSYLVRRLARIFQLDAPCLLCSRLDHLFENETPEFYLDLICGAHKLEISSLVFCHDHKKLADVHGMCEGCLRSFSTEKKFNSERYRLLVGTLGTDFDCADDQDHLLKDPVLGVSNKKNCSCCNEPWTPRLDTNKMVQFEPTGPEVAEHDILLASTENKNRHLHDGLNNEELPEVAEHDIPLLATARRKSLHLHDSLKFSDKISKEISPPRVGISTFDPLPHIGYSELKIASDTESEVSFSDDDDRSLLVRGRNDLDEEIIAQNVPLDPHVIHPEYFSKTLSDNFPQEELIHQVRMSVPSLVVPQAQHEACDSRDLTSSTSEAVVGHGLDELNSHQVENKIDASLSPEELIYQVRVSEPSLLVPQLQHDVGESHDLASSTSEAIVGHGLEDLNSHQVDKKIDASLPPDVPSPSNTGEVLLKESAETSAVAHGLEDLNSHQLDETIDASLQPELISLNDVPSSSKPREVLLAESAKTSVVGDGLEDLNLDQGEEKTDASLPTELISLKDVPSPSNVTELLLEESAETSKVTGTDVLEPASVKDIDEICELENNVITSSEPRVRTNQGFSDRGSPVTNLMDLNDAYELVVSNKVNQASNIPEQFTVKDSPRVSGDLKLWLSQISSARGVELSLSEISPRVYGQWEDLKYSDASSPIGLQILQKRISLERNMSGFESLDGSIVSEIEGESVVDRLKRQVDQDRKSMNALYKELEEERNASAVAANQALAMITRLQEEKATLQTEALQYLRMMEEQAEYDMDALQKANVLLAEKENEVEVLEAELEIYTVKSPYESVVKKNTSVDRPYGISVGYNFNTPCNTPREPLEGRKRPDKLCIVNGNNSTLNMKNSLAGFEDERSYISQSLKKLEKKLQLFSNNGVDFRNDGYSGKAENGGNHISQYDCEETHLVGLEHELSELNERLKTLEADRNFLEHTMNSLRTGDGMQFIQEIAQDLRELRRIGIRREEALE